MTSAAKVAGARWLRHAAALLICALGVAVIVLLVRAPPERLEGVLITSPPSAPSVVSPFLRGTYNSPIYLPQVPGQIRRIDAQATVRALQGAHIDTYAYLIWPDQTQNPEVSRAQFNDLPGFAREAGLASISVHVYLVPPTEAPVAAAYQPYAWDYIAWARAIGDLAARYPAIRGIMIDDFGGNTYHRASNLFVFSPDYVRRMMVAARGRAEWLTFSPVLYYHDIIGPRAMLSDYRSVVNTVVFPYHGASDGKTVPGNTRDATLSFIHGEDVAQVVRCQDASPCSQFVFPTRPVTDRTTDAAAFGGIVRSASHQGHVLTFDAKPNVSRGTVPDYVVEVWVGGQKRSTLNPADGWGSYRIDLEGMITSTDPVVEVKIRRGGFRKRDKLVVNVDNIRVSGSEMFNWTAGTSSEVRFENVATLQLLYMTYAIPLLAEQGVGAEPEYVAAVLSNIDLLKNRGLVDGSLVFNLPLGGATPQEVAKYQLVAQTYARWRQR